MSICYSYKSLIEEADGVKYRNVRAVGDEGDDIRLQRHEIGIQLGDFIQVTDINYHPVFSLWGFIRFMNGTSDHEH